MAMAIQIATFAYQWLYASKEKVTSKNENALRCGVLSTAMINPAGIIRPIESHPDVILSAIASRSLKDAKSTAQKYGIPTAYGSYEELLAEPGIDFVYISLPNALHAEWAIKALEAGKHVLLEKPFASNASEAQRIVDTANKKGLTVMEAFHWQCHPAAHAFKDIVTRGTYGKILSTYSSMTSPEYSIPEDNVRWDYDLAGGSLMDMTYVISSTRFVLGAAAPDRVTSANARLFHKDNRVDEAMNATMVFKVGSESGDDEVEYEVESEIYTDMKRAWVGRLMPRAWELPTITVHCEKATITLYNFMMPHLYHYICIHDKSTGRKTYQKHYTGSSAYGTRPHSANWSTYRFQLECFVDKLRGREPAHWVSNRSSVEQMKAIDMVYERAGLPLRAKESSQ